MAMVTVVEPEFGEATTIPLEFVTVHWYVLVGVRFWAVKITFIPTTAGTNEAETTGHGGVVNTNGPIHALASPILWHVSFK